MNAIPDEVRLLASLPLAIIVIDAAFRVAQVNPAAEQLLGQSGRRLVGKPMRDVLVFAGDGFAQRLAEGSGQISARGIPVRIAGAAERQMDIFSAPVATAEGWQILTLIEHGAVEDLAQQVDSPNTAVLRAPEILAHEIKNPLAGIRGAAQLVGRKLDPGDRALTRLIVEEVDRIAKLIDQMQPLSRKTLQPATTFNLHEAIRRACSIIHSAHPGIEIHEEFDPSLPQVRASPDELVQVILNLLTNAREASLASRSPWIGIRTRFANGIRLQPRTGGLAIRLPIEIRVSDNGMGIDPAVRQHLFEPFVTSKKQGQGLGLALVQKMVREMNGRVSHDRVEEDGLTHFRVHLPVAVGAKVPA